MKTRSSARTAEGLPQKRPSYNVEDVKYGRPTKRLKAPPKKKFPLMRLPAEIRLRILRELLRQAAPLEYTTTAETVSRMYADVGPGPGPVAGPAAGPKKANFNFHPAILRACRQLHDEGSAILYAENTFLLQIWHSCGWPTGYSCRFLDKDQETWELGTSQLRVVQRSKKLCIRVELVGVMEECAEIVRHAVRALVRVIQQRPNWTHLTICHTTNTCCHSYDLETGLEPNEGLLKPFGLVRHRHSVVFESYTSEFTHRLTKLMTGASSVVDLPQMYGELRTYVDQHLGWNDYLCDDAEEWFVPAEQAMDDEDEDAFFENRKGLFLFFDKYMHSRMDQLFKHDANPTRARLDCQQYAIQQQWKKKMEAVLRPVSDRTSTGAKRRVRSVSLP